MNGYERQELVEALDTIINSQVLFDEFENANYHSAWDFLEEVRDMVVNEQLMDDLAEDEDEDE